MTDLALLRALRSHPFAAAAIGTCLLVTGVLLSYEAYARPETEREVLVEPVWTERASYEYSVPVTRNATVWPIGTDLGMGRAAYYRSVSQYVHVNFSWVADDVEPGSGLAQANLTLHIRGQDRQGKVLWETTRPLTEDLVTDPPLGLRLSASVDLDEMLEDITILTRDLPLGDGAVNATIAANVSYTLRTARGDETGAHAFALPVTFQDPRFYLPAAQAVTWRDEHETQRVVESVAPAGAAGFARALPAQALILLGVATLAGGVVAWRTDPGRGLAPRDAAWAREHARYKEWVTTGAAPLEGAASWIDLPSLEELVRVAADGRTRVILDARTRTYYVAHPPLMYRYARHAR